MYHKVSKFYSKSSTTEAESQGIAPGRIGTVFFFPFVSYSELKDKPPGWGYKTGFGMNSNMFANKGRDDEASDEASDDD